MTASGLAQNVLIMQQTSSNMKICKDYNVDGYSIKNKQNSRIKLIYNMYGIVTSLPSYRRFKMKMLVKIHTGANGDRGEETR